jgi:hypothetical protein
MTMPTWLNDPTDVEAAAAIAGALRGTKRREAVGDR